MEGGSSVADVPTGPKDAKSTVLTIEEEAIIVAFRRHTPGVGQSRAIAGTIADQTGSLSQLVVGQGTGNGAGTLAITPGTRIAVPGGERAVESLVVGDLVLTLAGTAVPVRWIGRRRVDLASHPRPDSVRPVRIAAGAFGAGLPRRDLAVSPGHGN